MPPGAVNVWQKMLTYTGSCCRPVTQVCEVFFFVIKNEKEEVPYPMYVVQAEEPREDPCLQVLPRASPKLSSICDLYIHIFRLF